MSVRQPCPTCPWRVEADAADIPGFSLELAEGLAHTCSGEFGAPMMACHQSTEGRQFVCAGWLARHGEDSIIVRMVLMGVQGAPENASLKGISHEALEPGDGWPELHTDFAEMIQKLRQQMGDVDG